MTNFLKLAIFTTSLLAGTSSYAIKDNLKKTIEIAAAASQFQSERIKISAENIANEYTTSDTPGGMPYIRKTIYGKNIYDNKINGHLLKTKKISTDKRSKLQKKYLPNHPAANQDGYVLYPNVNRLIERADALEAKRGVEANLGVIEMSNSLIQKTIEAIK